jgi:hypothetical protein
MESQKTNLIAMIAGALTALGGLAGLIKSTLDQFSSAKSELEKSDVRVRWAVFAIIFIGSLIWLIKARTKRSRLLRPDAFNLQPDNPQHLKGRSEKIDELQTACTNAPLVWLTGESGSGKTALVRAGLLPALENTGILRPIYIDAWGKDWEIGPRDSIASVLQRSLGTNERSALDLTRPVGRDDVFPLLAVFRRKTGRVPLIIFDQFDDYQAAHRERFRRRGAWIKAASLIRANTFWRELKAHLAPSQLHCLFVVRADTAAALEAVRFSEPESLPLDRLNGEYLLPILDGLTATAAPDAPPNVANPEAGWAQLKRRLERDLTRDGVVLPIQIQSAIQGLAILARIKSLKFGRTGI